MSLQVEERLGLFQSKDLGFSSPLHVCYLQAVESSWCLGFRGSVSVPVHCQIMCQMWPMVMFLLNCTQCALVNLGILCFHARCKRTDDT